MKNSLVVGVDIGGSHITSALVDLDQRIVLNDTVRRAPVNAGGKAEDILSSWCDIIQSSYCDHKEPFVKIGIAMPGPFEYTKGISLMKNQDKYDALYGLNLKELLSGKLSIDPENITFANDAACFLQGEVFGGAAMGFKSVIGLTLGTGFGSSRFYHGFAEDANLWCASFRDGIAEDYLSTRWFLKRYAELTGLSVKNVKELTELDNEKAIVHKIFREFGKCLGTFLVPYVLQDTTEAVIIGGNIANAFHYFSDELQAVFDKNEIKAKVTRAVLNEYAALLGAASYCSIKKQAGITGL